MNCAAGPRRCCATRHNGPQHRKPGRSVRRPEIGRTHSRCIEPPADRSIQRRGPQVGFTIGGYAKLIFVRPACSPVILYLYDHASYSNVLMPPIYHLTAPELISDRCVLRHEGWVDMTEFEQTPFGGADLIENTEPRCACILLLDNSGSMAGEPIRQLNEGMSAFKQALSEDPLAAKRVELAIVTFGPVQTAAEFATIDSFYPPHLESAGATPLGGAIAHGLAMLRTKAPANNRLSCRADLDEDDSASPHLVPQGVRLTMPVAAPPRPLPRHALHS